MISVKDGPDGITFRRRQQRVATCLRIKEKPVPAGAIAHHSSTGSPSDPSDPRWLRLCSCAPQRATRFVLRTHHAPCNAKHIPLPLLPHTTTHRRPRPRQVKLCYAMPCHCKLCVLPPYLNKICVPTRWLYQVKTLRVSNAFLRPASCLHMHTQTFSTPKLNSPGSTPVTMSRHCNSRSRPCAVRGPQRCCQTGSVMLGMLHKHRGRHQNQGYSST